MNRCKQYLLPLSAGLWLCIGGCQADSDRVGERVQEAASELPGPRTVGEAIAASWASPAVAKTEADRPQLVWQQEIYFEGATYIAPHFKEFALPEGAYLIVRAAKGTRSRTYVGKGKDIPDSGGFWSMHMPGDRAVIELYSNVAVAEGAVFIDRFARGFEDYADMFAGGNDDFGTEAICGVDDSDWALCFESSEPEAYDKSRAVARLMIQGVSACTGWLIGSEGHLMTNEHCIGSPAAAANTDYEFMAQGASCDTDCSTFGGCPGVVEADSGELIQVNASLDYALIKLPENVSETYGFMQMRVGGGFVGERIFIPQHPAAWGKRIAFKDGDEDAVITTLEAPACTGFGVDVGYFADTQGGSSGSPVLSYEDRSVVALHHCANCPNRGVPVQPIIDDLAASDNLPEDAATTGCEPEPEADAGADRTICIDDVVALGGAALPGTSYSWSPGGETTAQIVLAPTETTTYTVTATTECDVETDTVTVVVADSDGTLYREDFNGEEASGWTTTGLWHHSADASCASPESGEATGAMYYGQDGSCNYNVGSNAGDLISPPIANITANSSLHFDFFRQVESASGSYDRTKVFISADNGATWNMVWSRDAKIPSASAWTTSEAVSLAEFAGATIHIRFAFNSVDAQANNFMGWMVDNVVIRDELLCGRDRAPIVTIASPADNVSLVEGDAISFAGNAFDREDGDLSGALSWTSSIDGAIGTGGSIASTLSRGSHTITASVTDSAGVTASGSVVVEVSPSPQGFFDDFDGGVASWSMSGLWHPVAHSACASPAFASPARAMYYGRDSTCNYSTNSATSGDLLSPTITGITAESTLQFDYLRDVESYEGGSFDRTEVAVTSDGDNFTTVWARTSSDASASGWHNSGAISLAEFAGQTIQIRFRFNSVDHVNNGFTGWLIDNVSVD